jgi:hypothetical protein
LAQSGKKNALHLFRRSHSVAAALYPGKNLSNDTQGAFQMKEIRTDQRWSEGFHEVQVTNAFGVRVRIRRNGAQADEEITEDDFRKRFTFVADR